MINRGLLNGRIVLELGGYLAAPFASSIMRGLGARIIKVEGISGDPFRQQKGLWVSTNAGKESVVCDLGSHDGAKLFQRLVSVSDIVVENMNPDAAVKYGITYSGLTVFNPSIILCSIKGFGAGPYSNLRATNPVIEAMVGLMSVTEIDGRPARQAVPLFDQMAGALAALGGIGALSAPVEEAYRSVEVDLFETALFMVGSRLADYQLDGPSVTTGGLFKLAPYGTFKVADDRWVFLGIVNDQAWRKFSAAVGIVGYDRSEFRTNEQRADRRPEVESITQRALIHRSVEEIVDIARGLGVPCAPVNDFGEVLADSHTRSEEKLNWLNIESKSIAIPNLPISYSGTRANAALEPPALGEHTKSIENWLNKVSSLEE